jgi:hypothetical protein
MKREKTTNNTKLDNKKTTNKIKIKNKNIKLLFKYIWNI